MKKGQRRAEHHWKDEEGQCNHMRQREEQAEVQKRGAPLGRYCEEILCAAKRIDVSFGKNGICNRTKGNTSSDGKWEYNGEEHLLPISAKSNALKRQLETGDVDVEGFKDGEEVLHRLGKGHDVHVGDTCRHLVETEALPAIRTRSIQASRVRTRHKGQQVAARHVLELGTKRDLGVDCLEAQAELDQSSPLAIGPEMHEEGDHEQHR